MDHNMDQLIGIWKSIFGYSTMVKFENGKYYIKHLENRLNINFLILILLIIFLVETNIYLTNNILWYGKYINP